MSGDSIPAGHTSASANDQPTQISNLLSAGNALQPVTLAGKWQVLNSAVQSGTMQGEIEVDAGDHDGDNAGSGLVPVYSPAKQYQFYRKRHIVIGCEQTNSITSGSTAADTIDGCSQWVQARINDGYEPGILLTYLADDATSLQQAVFESVQSDLRTSYRFYGAKFLVDLSAIPQFNPVGASKNPAYFFDGVHLNPKGQNVFAAYTAAMLANIGVH